jgi:hypothetical protein
MKKNLLTILIFTLVFATPVYAEKWIEDYGYYENKNEILAKR